MQLLGQGGDACTQLLRPRHVPQACLPAYAQRFDTNQGMATPAWHNSYCKKETSVHLVLQACGFVSTCCHYLRLAGQVQLALVRKQKGVPLRIQQLVWRGVG